MAQNTYDTNGRVATRKASTGGVFQFAYTPVNTLVPTSPITQTVVTDPLGHSTTYRFNTQGYMVSATDASGQTRNVTRASGTNFVLSMTGAGTCATCGDITAGDATFTYDSNGNILTQTDTLGNQWTFTYDPIFNSITSVTDPSGNTTQYAYDNHGNLSTITDARGNSRVFTRDVTGLLTSSQDAAGNVTRLAYDSSGRSDLDHRSAG